MSDHVPQETICDYLSKRLSQLSLSIKGTTPLPLADTGLYITMGQAPKEMIYDVCGTQKHRSWLQFPRQTEIGWQCHHRGVNQPCKRTPVVPWNQGLRSLKSHRVIGTGIPIINLRRSWCRLMFIMGILTPIRRCIFGENRPNSVHKHVTSSLLSVEIFSRLKCDSVSN